MTISEDPPKTRARRRRAQTDVVAIMEAVETQRSRLMKAESALHCAIAALDGENCKAGRPYYPDVLELAGDLLRESINQLDSMRLRALAEQSTSGADYAPAEEKVNPRAQDDNLVKESNVTYLY